MRRVTHFIRTHPLFIQLSLGASMVTFAFICLLRLGEDILEKEVISFDTSIVSFIYSFRSDALTRFVFAITAIGSPLAAAIFSVIVFVFLFKYGRKRNEAVLFSFIFISASVLNTLLKIFFARPRPTLLPLAIENSYSFPSGHSMNSFVFFTMLSYFVYRNTRNAKLTFVVSLISLFLVVLIGFSRVYLGVHYPSDVIAGYLAGLLWCTSIIMIEKYIHWSRVLH